MTITTAVSPYKGSGQITREQFLFYEMRTVAKLTEEGLEEKEIVQRVVEQNLFQYPTERMLAQMTRTCIRRLQCLEDSSLITAIAMQPTDVAKQICLYAMMKQYRLVWDFMITVIGEKYRMQDFIFSKMDVNVFLMQLQEQDDYVAGWSEATIHRIGLILIKILVENEYLDHKKSERLNPVWLHPILENTIKSNGETRVLTAFNNFS